MVCHACSSTVFIAVVRFCRPRGSIRLTNGHRQAAPAFAGRQEKSGFENRAAETWRLHNEIKKIIFPPKPQPHCK
jgi:hypothetical protein